MNNSHTISSKYGIVIFIAILAVVLGIIVYSNVKRKGESFEGVVTDKDIIETQQMNDTSTPGANGINIGNYGNGGIRHSYRIKVKDDSGKDIKYSISAGMYEIIKIGDRVSKAKGTTDIKILSSSKKEKDSSKIAHNQTPPNSPTTIVN